MDPNTLPHWAQSIFYIIMASGAAFTALLSYHKKKVKEDSEAPSSAAAGSSSVISASFIESKLLKELIEALRDLQEEQGRDNKKLHRLSQDLAESVGDLNESVKNQIDVSKDLVRAINRRASRDLE